MARLFSSEKARRQGADEPCEKPSAKGGYAPDNQKLTAAEALLSSRQHERIKARRWRQSSLPRTRYQ